MSTMNARSEDALVDAADAIRAETGVEVTPVAADFNTDEGRAAILEAAGDVDILVSNPGVRQVPTPWEEITPKTGATGSRSTSCRRCR